MKKKDRQEEPREPIADPAADKMDGSGQDMEDLLETAADDAHEPGEATAEPLQQPVTEEQTVLKALRDSLATKEKETSILSDKYLRLMAEYDNFRKRSQKEKDALYVESIIQVIREWLPVIDNLDRAEWAADQYESAEAQRIADGITLIRKQVQDVLDKLGVESISCCGQPFDPNLHDAVLHVEDESAGPSTVVEELRKGYRREDRVIRHSVVKVAN